MAGRFRLERDLVRLEGVDFGGDGPATLLLHGLAGHAGEWARTAAGLAPRRTVALDLRGHGGSERRPADVSLDAHAADAVHAIEQLGLGPVVLVGQSLGGAAAAIAAAARPALVRALVLADVDLAAAADPGAEATTLEARLTAWPVPFADRGAAVAFFSGRSADPEAWAAGLEQRDGGWWPRFDVDVMVRTLRGAAARSCWAEWRRVRCPTLVVRAGAGALSGEVAREMVGAAPDARLVEIAGAGHDVHLDRPEDWCAALRDFLLRTEPGLGRKAGQDPSRDR